MAVADEVKRLAAESFEKADHVSDRGAHRIEVVGLGITGAALAEPIERDAAIAPRQCVEREAPRLGGFGDCRVAGMAAVEKDNGIAASRFEIARADALHLAPALGRRDHGHIHLVLNRGAGARARRKHRVNGIATGPASLTWFGR